MKFTTKEDAISKIKDGSSIIFSGFQMSRAPIAFVNEIVKQRIKDLGIFSLPNPLPLDILIKNRLVRKATFAFNGFSFEGGFKILPNWRNAIEDGLIDYKETDVYEIIQGMEAGILNKGYEEIDWLRNSDYIKYNKYEKRNGKIITNAIKPDVAILHAQLCDEEGNVRIFDTLTDNLLWKCSKKVIVSVEEKVKKLDSITIPNEKIQSIVVLQKGAYPTACFCYYNYSLMGIYDYLDLSFNGANNSLPYDKMDLINNKKIEAKSINGRDIYSSISDGNLEKFNIDSQKEKGIKSQRLTEKNINKRHIDHLICILARQIKKGSTVLTGVASPIPMLACLLAQEMKSIRYINCSGAINPRPVEIPFGSANINFLMNKEKFIELCDIFKTNIDTLFMGAVQIDANGNINMTCIGDYIQPKVKLPGPAATIYLRNKVKNPIVVIPNHSKRVFVKNVDFITSMANNNTLVISNLGILNLGKNPGILGYYNYSSPDEIVENTSFLLEEGNAKKIKDPTAEEIRKLQKIDTAGVRYRL